MVQTPTDSSLAVDCTSKDEDNAMQSECLRYPRQAVPALPAMVTASLYGGMSFNSVTEKMTNRGKGVLVSNGLEEPALGFFSVFAS